MTSERNNSRLNPEDYGRLVLTKLPGQELVILDGDQEVVTVMVDAVNPSDAGLVLTVNVLNDQFQRVQIDNRDILNDGQGNFIVIKGERVNLQTGRTKVVIEAHKRYKVHKRELLEKDKGDRQGLQNK